MRVSLRLFAVTAEASTIVAVGYLALFMIAVMPFWTPGHRTTGQVITAFAVVVIPVAAATWWMARKLRGQYSQREARAVATSFAITSPLSMAVSMPLALFPAFYAGNLWRPLVLVGMVAGVAIVVTLITFLINAFALWFTRLIVRVEMRQRIE